MMIMCEDKIAFVYEAVRHGARAPHLTDLSGFQVKSEMLTASGIRQRHLLGKRNRDRYITKYSLLDAKYNPSQIHIQCTNIYRVI